MRPYVGFAATFAFAALCSESAAFAESLPPDVHPTDCTTPGWMLDDSVPAAVGNLSLNPVVLLPVVPTPGAHPSAAPRE